MNVLASPISGLFIAQTSSRADSRGAFTRLFCERDLATLLGPRRIVQINHSRTASIGAVRGLHFQHAPHAEMKLVRCLRGRVWDVAVDLRAGSETFLRWYARELDPGTDMMVIPEGFAHGFQVLEPDSELLYLHTAFHAPGSEGGLHHRDPRLGIQWPLPTGDISDRDSSHPLLSADFAGLYT